MFKNRIKDSIENGMDKGKRFFFLYGEGIKDYFLDSIYEAPHSLSGILKNYFLINKKDEYSYFVNFTPENQIAFELKDDKIVEDADFFEPETKGDLPLEDEIANNNKGQEDPEAKRLRKSIERRGNVLGKNCIAKLKERIKENTKSQDEKKFAVLFEDFDWQADLYKNEPNLERIRELKDFLMLENTTVVVSLEDIELLKRYNFETKGCNVIYVGNPSAAEVKYTYLRKYLICAQDLSRTQNKIQFKFFDELEDISNAMASSKKSLRDALNVYDKVAGMEIHKEDFEIAVEKIIEEKISLDDVILDDNIKDTIVKAVDTFLLNDNVSEYRKGLILKGPSGTGKTQLVKALASEKNCYFMAPTLSDLKGEYIGHTSAKVKRIFDEARANAPTILFIDEADTVFPGRDVGAGGSDSFNLDMVNQFLQEIDGMKTGGAKIFTIAATNRSEIIDTAIKSRLSQEIEIGLPNREKRIKIFDSKLDKYGFRLSGKPYEEEIAKKSEKMSGRDIDNFVKKLNEKISGTSYKEIKNLNNDNEGSKQIFLEILQDNEQLLIEEMQHAVPVEITSPAEITKGFESIIGYDDVKQHLRRQAEFIKSSAENIVLRMKYGVKGERGVLLYGPPGNAKTEMAKALAKESDFYFVKVLSKDFVSSYFEKQLSNLQIIFDMALRLSKITSRYKGVVLFFDEFDSLAAKVSLSNVIRGTLLDYLANENGIRADDGKVLFMAAANSLEDLDEAVIRKGRIDEHLYMGNPNIEHGKKILEQIFKDDTKVETVSSDIIGTMYDKLHEQTFRIYNTKMNLLERNTGRKFNRLEKADVRPSGSDIINLCREIKSEAFFLQFAVGKLDGERKIKIDDEIVDNYFYRDGEEYVK